MRTASAPLPVTPTTIYDIASLTKLFTLVSVLQLIEADEIRFTDQILKLDPRFVHLRNCTVEEVLTYLACLQTPERVDKQADAMAAERMVFQTRRVPVQGFKLYSDMNALVLKYVVESVSGLPFLAYLQKHVFQPAGMKETWASVPDDRLADVMNYNYEHRLSRVGTRCKRMSPGLPPDPKARLLKSVRMMSAGTRACSLPPESVQVFSTLLNGKLISRDKHCKSASTARATCWQTAATASFLGCWHLPGPASKEARCPRGWACAPLASPYTGFHFALDPDAGVFDIVLYSRCHNHVSPGDPGGCGQLGSANGSGRPLISPPVLSFRFIHQRQDAATPSMIVFRPGWFRLLILIDDSFLKWTDSPFLYDKQ